MKPYFSKKHITKPLIVIVAVMTMTLVSCREEIDESNLYTFTGETIEDYLVNRPDQFSHFNYILSRIGYDKILSAYGVYTCFAPSNEAVIAYIDSLYDDPNNKELPHNGMTARGLEGLTDSLCKDIALFHLLPSELKTVEMKLDDGSMTYETMLGRDITVGIDSIGIKVQKSHITLMDNELENGVLHEIDQVLTRSNNLLSMEIAKYEEYTLFTDALIATSLLDSLNEVERKGVIMPTKYFKNPKVYTPNVCKLGFTVFAETDKVLKANGINSLDDLAAYAAKVYGDCAKKDGGWYDYLRNKGIEVSTGTDYSNPYNTLNMFMRYHILAYSVPYGKFFYTKAHATNAPVFEYMETMLPYTLMKVSRVNGVPRINRWVTNNTLTDRVADVASENIAQVRREGILVKNDNIQSLNGYIHPIDGMLVYDEDVPRGTLNERLRFDFLSLLPEMMSNGLRCKPAAEVVALTGGDIGNDGFQ
ncbi:MAG: fasciclin domain-containing protein [Prevotella sp.]|nr:fasciclin domain-containing protein [Prevotella sp.]